MNRRSFFSRACAFLVGPFVAKTLIEPGPVPQLRRLGDDEPFCDRLGADILGDLSDIRPGMIARADVRRMTATEIFRRREEALMRQWENEHLYGLGANDDSQSNMHFGGEWRNADENYDKTGF